MRPARSPSPIADAPPSAQCCPTYENNKTPTGGKPAGASRAVPAAAIVQKPPLQISCFTILMPQASRRRWRARVN
jgi:hypothetical protein